MKRRVFTGPSLALGGVAATCIVSYARVFSGRSWLVPALVGAAGGLALTRWLIRRTDRLPALLPPLFPGRALLVGAVVVLAGLWFAVLVALPSTSVLGLPGPASLRGLAHALRDVRNQWANVSSPIAPDTAFLVLIAASTWGAGALSGALLGRWSYRGRRLTVRQTSVSPALLAPLPWVALFTVAAGVGRGAGRQLDAAAFVAALLGFLLVEGRSPLGRLRPLGGALRLGSVSLAGAILLPSLVPGARSGPIFPWARLGPQSQTTISPLVQIQPMILRQSNVTLFHVTADRPAYWRLTSLDRFDGNTWSSEGSYNPARGALSKPPRGLATLDIHQRYRVDALGGIWIPSAFAPAQVSVIRDPKGGRATPASDPNSQTLIGTGLQPGDTYSVVSQVPQPNPADLAGRGVAVPPGSSPQQGDLALPAGTRALIRPIALSLAGQAATAYDKALAMQDYLRQNFTYDEQVPAGSGGNYLYQFLTQIRRGYCEQFAGAMAVMLRTLGIPARVAVGFLPGHPGPASGADSTYTVTGHDAHAWPEAYFAGIGWVAFEPTPRTDSPTPFYATTRPAAGTAPPAAAPAVTAVPSPAEASPQPGAGQGPSAVPGTAGQPGAGAARRAAQDIGLGVGILLLGLFLARETRLRLPGLLARSPEARAVAAFQEFSLRAADAVGPRRSGETEAEYAGNVVGHLAVPPQEVGAVTAAYQKAAYSQRPPNPGELHAALQANRALRRGLWRRAGWWGRVRLTFSARPLTTRTGSRKTSA